MRLARRDFNPFATRGRRTLGAILVIFAAFSVLSVAFSIRATSRSPPPGGRDPGRRAAAHARRALRPAGPARPRRAGRRSRHDGGHPPPQRPRPARRRNGARRRRRRRRDVCLARRPTRDPRAAAAGAAARLRSHGRRQRVARAPARSPTVPLTAHEHLRVPTRSSAARARRLTSNVSLNAARTIASRPTNITSLITLQVAARDRRAAHIAALRAGRSSTRRAARPRTSAASSPPRPTSSLVFGAGGCRYVSGSVTAMLGRPERSCSARVSTRSSTRTTAPRRRGLPRRPSARSSLFRAARTASESGATSRRTSPTCAPTGTIRGIVLNARDVTERVQLEEELTHQAFHDGLTGLANRALFRDRLDQALARSERTREPLAVLLVDLDGFKQVNDSLGHDAGDELLEQRRASGSAGRPAERHAGAARRRRVRACCSRSRTRRPRVAVADRLLEALDRARHASPATSSSSARAIGIAVHAAGAGARSSSCATPTSRCTRRRRAAAAATRCSTPEMAQRARRAARPRARAAARPADGRVQRPLPAGDRRSSTGQIVGVEALLRWTSPTRGLVPPRSSSRSPSRPASSSASASSCCARPARRPRAGARRACSPSPSRPG